MSYSGECTYMSYTLNMTLFSRRNESARCIPEMTSTRNLATLVHRARDVDNNSNNNETIIAGDSYFAEVSLLPAAAHRNRPRPGRRRHRRCWLVVRLAVLLLLCWVISWIVPIFLRCLCCGSEYYTCMLVV